jgi:hypothetical protein
MSGCQDGDWRGIGAELDNRLFIVSLFIERGELANSNAEQVGKIRRILAEMGREPASPAEARQMLGLEGKSEVSYR